MSEKTIDKKLGIDNTPHRWWPPAPFCWTTTAGKVYNGQGEQMFRMGCQIKDPKSRIFAFVRKEDGSKHQRPQFVTSRGDDPWNVDNINWAYDRRGKQTYYIGDEIMDIAQKVNGIAVRGHVVKVNSIRCTDRRKDATLEGNGVWCLVWNTSKTILPPMPLEAWEQRNIKKFKKAVQGQQMPKGWYNEAERAKGSNWWNENANMAGWEACTHASTQNANKLKEELLTAVGYNKDDAISNLKNIVFIGEMATSKNNEGKRSLHEANAFLQRYGINFDFETLSENDDFDTTQAAQKCFSIGNMEWNQCHICSFEHECKHIRWQRCNVAFKNVLGTTLQPRKYATEENRAVDIKTWFDAMQRVAQIVQARNNAIKQFDTWNNAINEIKRSAGNEKSAQDAAIRNSDTLWQLHESKNDYSIWTQNSTPQNRHLLLKPDTTKPEPAATQSEIIVHLIGGFQMKQEYQVEPPAMIKFHNVKTKYVKGLHWTVLNDQRECGSHSRQVQENREEIFRNILNTAQQNKWEGAVLYLRSRGVFVKFKKVSKPMTLKPAEDGKPSDKLDTYMFTKYAEDETEKERIRIQFKHRFELPQHSVDYYQQTNPSRTALLQFKLPTLPMSGQWVSNGQKQGFHNVATVEKMLNYLNYNEPGCRREPNIDETVTLLPLRNLHVYFVYRFLMDRVPLSDATTYDHAEKKDRKFELKDDIEYVVQISNPKNMVANFLQSIFNTKGHPYIGTVRQILEGLDIDVNNPLFIDQEESKRASEKLKPPLILATDSHRDSDARDSSSNEVSEVSSDEDAETFLGRKRGRKRGEKPIFAYLSAQGQAENWQQTWAEIKQAQIEPSHKKVGTVLYDDDTSDDQGGSSAQQPRRTDNPYVIILKLSNFHF